MSNLKLAITNYWAAEARLFQEVLGLLSATDGLLSQIKTRRTVHGGPVRNVRNPVVLDQPLETIEHSFQLPFDVIRSTDIEQFTIIVFNLANDFKRSTSQLMFRIIDAVTEATGNVIKAQGQEISHDRLIDMIERVHISFDEDGNHKLSLVLPSEDLRRLASIQPTEEQVKRHEQIIARKREEFNASKSHRKLY